jgi:hypothetical protein
MDENDRRSLGAADLFLVVSLPGLTRQSISEEALRLMDARVRPAQDE